MIQLNDLIFYAVMIVLMIGVIVMGWVLYGKKLVQEKFTEKNNKLVSRAGWSFGQLLKKLLCSASIKKISYLPKLNTKE